MSRKNIHYWKCDRPAAFHGTETSHGDEARIAEQLSTALGLHFDARSVALRPGTGQGNHRTWRTEIDGVPMFLRVETGPEQDHHLAVESAILDQVREIGVRTPLVHGCDASRQEVPFAWQALEFISDPDLNQWQKQGGLDDRKIAFQIGAAVATWQAVELPGFGVPDESLQGCHETYAGYFFLQLDRHLAYLVEHDFLDATEPDEISATIADHSALLERAPGCLVHKDLALWNILGTPDNITAFIDFDDAISGDPMDDLSLLGCFHDASFLRRAVEGYQSVRPLPGEYRCRFWLHLLRNMIVKAVIRVGAGYFDRDDRFFLIGNGGSGADLKSATRKKINDALSGLRGDLEIGHL